MLDGRILLAGFMLAACGMRAGADTEPQVMEDDESSLMVIELHRENEFLREKVQELSGQIEELQRQLAEARARLDLLKADEGMADIPAEKPAAAMSYRDITRLRVMDVNRKMKVAVVSGGLRAGMKVGMRFSILRDDEAVAEIRLVEVRENFAGGLIEKLEKDLFPETGDRLVLSSSQD